MLSGVSNGQEKSYTVADVYKQTQQMVREEMEDMKKRPLTKEEIDKTEGIARIMAHHVLKDMNLI
ncbi:MAG: hypothetical protein KKB81_05915 [Candidatus Margulisbacteria bacterium]|nr:hypothetical protein [Candidatus Margulisiibacteriota bacterium]MBU1021819.1 hypothetical protein [Candidatus Margulisiibacteriota bacterium]MBU1728978.1 hypothetical protein [Candidatus Margulisiibacteriota bacterium]MBU1954469.1 hypothetical protein [Candidatus Margulisiibacteriota bacterium]